MTILMLAHPDGTSEYPVPTFVHDQAAALHSLGCRVFILVPVAYGREKRVGSDGDLRPLEIDGIQYRFFRFLSLSVWGVYWFNFRSCFHASLSAIHAILKTIQPDVLVAHMFELEGATAVRLKKKFGLPVVVITHGSDIRNPIQSGKMPFLLSIARKADAIVAVSQSLANLLLSLDSLLPVTVINNGFAAMKLPKKFTARIPHSILYVGNLIKQKNAGLVIRAFANIKENTADATLYLIGSGPMRKELEQLCGELGVLNSVTFAGQLPNDQVLARMAQSDIFCMPSVREGFGVVYLEAMVSGCVTIGTKGEGIDGIIRNNENGILVNPNPEEISNAFMLCFSNPDHADLIRKNGMETAGSLTWAHNARKHMELYRSIL